MVIVVVVVAAAVVLCAMVGGCSNAPAEAAFTPWHPAGLQEERLLRPLRTGLEFVWVEDFPLFVPTAEGGSADAIESTHHMFTAPHPADAARLTSDPLSVRGLHYDIVLNGVELVRLPLPLEPCFFFFFFFFFVVVG